MQNIRQVATGHGLGNVSSLDRAIWQEFGETPELVQRLVDAIGEEVASGEVDAAEVAAVDEEFAEGRVLTAMHRRRERNQRRGDVCRCKSEKPRGDAREIPRSTR